MTHLQRFALTAVALLGLAGIAQAQTADGIVLINQAAVDAGGDLVVRRSRVSRHHLRHGQRLSLGARIQLSQHEIPGLLIPRPRHGRGQFRVDAERQCFLLSAVGGT